MKPPHGRLWVRHVDGPLGIKSDLMRILSCQKKSHLWFPCTKNGQRLNLYNCGVSDVAIFLGMRVFCLKYPFSHRKWFSGKKAPSPRDLPILKWSMGRVKALAGSWVWTAAVGWRGGSLTRKRPVKIALRYIGFLKWWYPPNNHGFSY